MKRFLSMFMSIVMLLSITAGMNITANAEVFSGYCGDNLTYNLDTDSGVLTISGTGEMYDYSSSTYAPWYSNRSSVKTVEIKSGITSIGDYAFFNCDSLTSITIPNSVTSIGDWAFSHCDSLTSITISNSVTSIGDYAFWYCYSLTSITIPNSVTSIGGSAFSQCYSLTSITIPNSVISIGDYAFYNCDSLTRIDVDDSNQNYSSQDGVLFNKDKTVLIQYPIGNTRTSYTIPNSVTYIGVEAFENCDSLTSITIPNSVTYIGVEAFENCDSLTSIIIPNSVTSIGDYAFYGCNSLSDVYYSDSEAEWKAISIGSYNECLTNATIHYNSTGPENPGGSTGGGGFVPATPEEPATTEPTTQPSTKPSAPAPTTTKKPSTVKVEKVTKGTKSFKVTWKKKTGVSGYQVQYATDKKFKKNKKTVTIAKKNATSKTIKKLKSNKTYYVRVRTYNIVNGKKVYSSWSKVKAVKTK